MIADTLVIETAASACSIALISVGEVTAYRHDSMARGHAEHLLPMMAALPDQGRAGSILVDCGPGSFTGVRVGIAAARALGFAWQVPVHGFRTLDLLAVMAGRALPAQDRFLVVTLGGHGEWFVQPFVRTDNGIIAAAPFQSLLPEAAITAHGAEYVAIGSAAAAYAAHFPEMAFLDLAPDAREALWLPAEMILQDAQPIYGRGADAKPMAPLPA
ncbi:tRNA (adenosine(37)-N6)-threonylcarbamoyltransferase complex dimerization subunit type 1 TsaB [Aquisediminimonas sediminicola]|uniref:tRNA (adenosine(37)-N6)-threonylcarbamoyltransferase complex dimerization subunit type 1 TsaB n=1 Tax=Alteraquisediminimonas sediminicola TaxID=2676787 RepID=UPI001C8D3943|nr:tRNA (adenosine(37)-N6)-threonylcarbamoyltransferase complex dimerization subunit type 1 TsaB [Aquisediminimonas sediminicola]